MRTAAVVPPQIGQGMPVNARNGHTVAGRPGIVRCASVNAPIAPKANRAALDLRPERGEGDERTLSTASSATASPCSAFDVSCFDVHAQRHHPDRSGSGQGLEPTPRGGRRFRASRVATASMESMTDTLTRPVPAAVRRPVRTAAPRRRVPGARPRLLVGIGVALWTALLGLALPVCVTLSAWVTAAHHDDAVRPALAMAVQIWLVAHHAGLHLTGGSFSMVPLGLSMAFAVLLMRAGRQVARLSGAHDRFDALTTGLSIALPYSVVAALLTRAGQSGQVRPAPLEAMAGAFTLALVFAVIGALCETDQLSGLARAVPADVRAVLRAALFATATVIGVGFVLVAVGLATHAERAAAFVGSLHGGIAAAALMVVASIAYLPN